MTDNEIIKALECHRDLDTGCDECPYCDDYYGNYCGDDIISDCWELIQKQKAEIETLKAELKFYKDNYLSLAKEWQEYPIKTVVGNNSEIHSKTAKDYDNLIADIKTEAIKDFAERLKKDSHIRYDSDTNEVIGAIVYCGEIDNLVKEMTEVE